MITFYSEIGIYENEKNPSVTNFNKEAEICLYYYSIILKICGRKKERREDFRAENMECIEREWRLLFIIYKQRKFALFTFSLNGSRRSRPNDP